MKKFVPGTIFLVFFLLLAPVMAAECRQWEALFFRANQAYKEGRYQESIDNYSKLIQSGLKNGHIYYNLGNSYFKKRELGRAIFNYERARLWLPGDADLKYNLAFAYDQTRDAVIEPQSLVSITFFWLKEVTLIEVFWGFAIMNLMFWGILFVRLFLRSEWTYYLFLVFLVFWIIGGLSFGLKYYRAETDDRAVIIKNEVNILAGPDNHDTVLFKLHEGTVVHYERSEDGWSLVHLPDKKRGWVKGNGIEIIRKTRSTQDSPRKLKNRSRNAKEN
ncbi:MAG TPA: hypothetical protein DDW42_06320 [Desulfobacteraceae bacterium]|nr:hypothetical protein [Desulfobacteraceae bacterium]